MEEAPAIFTDDEPSIAPSWAGARRPTKIPSDFDSLISTMSPVVTVVAAVAHPIAAIAKMDI